MIQLLPFFLFYVLVFERAEQSNFADDFGNAKFFAYYLLSG